MSFPLPAALFRRRALFPPIEWPPPGALLYRVVMWAHLLTVAALAAACVLGWWVLWALGAVLGLAVGCVGLAVIVVLGLPVLALFALGGLLRLVVNRLTLC